MIASVQKLEEHRSEETQCQDLESNFPSKHFEYERTRLNEHFSGNNMAMQLFALALGFNMLFIKKIYSMHSQRTAVARWIRSRLRLDSNQH